MASKKTGAKAAPKKPTKKEMEKAFLAKAEERLVSKYNSKKFEKVIPGSIKRGSGKLDGKLTVEIRTLGEDGSPDGKTLRVATSDVHQVNHQPEVAEALRRAARNERARAKRAAARRETVSA